MANCGHDGQVLVRDNFVFPSEYQIAQCRVEWVMICGQAQSQRGTLSPNISLLSFCISTINLTAAAIVLVRTCFPWGLGGFYFARFSGWKWPFTSLPSSYPFVIVCGECRLLF